MAFQKNFVVKNGIEVNNTLIFADKTKNTVGIGTTLTPEKLQVNGGIGATSIVLTGVGTLPTLKSTNALISNLYAVSGVVTSISGFTANYTTGNFGIVNATNVNAVSGVVTNLSGTISTYSNSYTSVLNAGTVLTPNLYAVSGVVTSISGSTANYTTGNFGIVNVNNLNAISGVVTNLSGTISTYSNSYVTTLNSGTVLTPNLYAVSGVVTSISGSTANYTTGNFGIVNVNKVNAVSGVVTNLSGTISTYTNSYSTILNSGTVLTPNLYAVSGVVTSISGSTVNYTNLTGSRLNISGVSTVTSLSIGSNQVISSGRQLQNILSLDSTTTSTIQNAITFSSTFSNIDVVGVSTLGNVEVYSGIITAASGIVTYYGDGQYLQNLPSASPGGSNTQVQYNNLGLFAGSSNFVFDGGSVTVGSAVTLNSTGINAPTGIVTATTFSGALSGNATSATTATNANNINVADESADTTCFPVFTTSATGNQAPKTDSSSLLYNASTGTLSATTFSGALIGNATTATTATNANNINISATTSTDTTTSVVLVADQATGNQSPFIDSGLTYDANTNNLSATTFTGALSGNATSATTATTATNANNINISATTSTDTTTSVVLVANQATGNQSPFIDSGLLYDANTNNLSATTFTGALSGNATSATNADNINISATTSTDTTTSVVLVGNQATGNQSPFIDSGLTYDANTNTLSATTFSGALSGNATSATSATTATTATNADNINISATTSTDTTTSVVLVADQATGNQSPFIDSGLLYDANTNNLSATTFTGALSGNATTATTATNANNINISATTSTDTTTSIVLVANQATGNQSPFIDSGLTYDANTNTLSATTFSGALSGNATTATTATTATNANNINISATTSTDTTTSIVLVANQATGNQSPFIDSGLTYDANTNNLSATTFTGALSGNATTATNANNINLADESADTTCFPIFATAATGNQAPKTDSSSLLYNASTGNLSSTEFTSLSDETKKTNIHTIENSIEITKQLRGVKFNWIDNDKPSVGVIAQEVEKVLPELVSNTSPKTVNYNGLIGVLIEAIKEQQIRIEELERKLNA